MRGFGCKAWVLGLMLGLGCSGEKHSALADTNAASGGHPATPGVPAPIVEDPGPATDTVCEASLPNGFCYAHSKHELLTDGQPLSLGNEDATFTSIGAGGAYIIIETPAGGRWTTEFIAASNHYFVPGPYYSALRAGFNPFGSPGLDVSVNYTGCNELSGKFTVTELETDSFGYPARFAASFVQHCEYLPEPLAGVIHFNATGVPDVAPEDPSVCEVAAPVGFCFSSQAGHPEGYGRRVSIDETTAGFSVTSSARGRVAVNIEGNNADGFLWQAALGGPGARPLAVGHYSNTAATKALFENPACEALAGSFDVLAIEYDDPGLNQGAGGAGGADTGSSGAAGESGAAGAAAGTDLRRFDVDFSYGCQQTQRELHGKLRYAKP